MTYPFLAEHTQQINQALHAAQKCDVTALLQFNNRVLSDACRAVGLAVSGTKDTMVNRFIGSM